VAKQAQNLSEIYAERAMGEPDQPVSTISIPRIREARDMVYSGTTPSQVELSNETVNAPSSPKNRKTSRRKISPFNVIVILVGGAVISVL
jgi:hypothetical protein